MNQPRHQGRPSQRPARQLFAIALLAAATVAQAQTPPPGALPNAQQLNPPLQRPATDRAALPRAPGPARELERPADELRIDVAAYVLDGGPPALQQALARITAPYVGKGRGYEDLLEAANAVTVFLQTQLGHYLGYAYLPEQVPRDGVVRIAVLEGRLDRVLLQWRDGLPVRREVVEAYLERLRPGSVLTVADVERVVFLVNDLRGINARFEFREGREWGTAELVVTPSADERWANRIELDSDGSRYSGVERLGWQSMINSPGGRGDGITLGALASASGGLAFGLVGYTTPVGSDGLKLGASVSAFRYRLDKDLLPQDVNGTALAFTAYALSPWIRSRNLNLFALGSIDHKRFADRQGAPDEVEVRKTSTELRLGLSGDFRDDLASGGVSTYETSATFGRVDYQLNAPAFTDDDARIGKLGFGYSRLQNVVGGRLLAYLNLRGQVAFRNLDATQQFRLGGADGVRAFAPGELPGDSGYVASLELRWLPPTAWFGDLARELVFSVFYDAGEIRLRKDTSQRPPDFANTAHLAGAGIGLAWERPQNFNFRIYLAEPTQGDPTGDPVRRHPRVYALFAKKL